MKCRDNDSIVPNKKPRREAGVFVLQKQYCWYYLIELINAWQSATVMFSPQVAI